MASSGTLPDVKIKSRNPAEFEAVIVWEMYSLASKDLLCPCLSYLCYFVFHSLLCLSWYYTAPDRQSIFIDQNNHTPKKKLPSLGLGPLAPCMHRYAPSNLCLHSPQTSHSELFSSTKDARLSGLQHVLNQQRFTQNALPFFIFRQPFLRPFPAGLFCWRVIQ